jgi:hypothetical protein
MPNLESAQTWTFTGSTGTGKAFNAKGYGRAFTFGTETSSGCTGTIVWLHRMGSSAGPYHTLHSTALSTGQFLTQQSDGPLEWVKPRLSDLTAGSTNIVRCYLMGN